MATVSKWTPFGVALDITATAGTVTRTSATAYTVVLNVSWETYYSGAQTNYGMSATSGGVTKTISAFNGTKRSSGSGSFTGTYSISGNGSASKTITVTFKNFNTDNGDSASKSISLNVSVPAWTSYAIKYNANGGSGAPSSQTKWKNQTLTLSSTKPTRTGYTFKNWNTASNGSGTSYASGASYTANAAATLYAQWTAITYKVTYNANGGTLGSVTSQTKTYGTALTLTGTATRSGYNFKGWATSANATTATYEIGASYTANANITLYAVWEVAYFTPKIKNISITRYATSALISFKYETSVENSTLTIEWEETATGVKDATTPVVSEAKTGSYSTTIGGILSTVDYILRITVEDEGGSYTAIKELSGSTYPFGMLPNNKGISFGKTPTKEGYADFGFKTNHRDSAEFDNNKCIYGKKSDGTTREVINPINENGNTVIGYGNYSEKEGQTNIYGYDLNFGVSNIAEGESGYYRPYRRQGDTMTLSLRTAGYITNSKKDLSFWIPMAIPIIGSPTVTITCINGFQLRQGDKYISGSSASVYAIPTSIEAIATAYNGIYVKAVFDDTTNVTNNDTVGIYWNGTISFT